MLTKDSTSSSPIQQKWGRITHIKGSTIQTDEQFAFFIGRWQPLHRGHKEMFNRALKKGKKVCIAIQDVQPDEKNPFSTEEVKSHIEIQMSYLVSSGLVKIIVIPDICSIEFGRGVEYDIIEHVPPLEIKNISATNIRKQMREGGAIQ